MLANFLLLVTVALHPFYVSVTNANFNAEAHTLECSTRIFTDDLEKAMDERGYGLLHLNSEKELAEADSLIGHYVTSCFTVVTDKGPRRLVYIGREYEDDGTYVYFQAEAITPRFKWVEINSNLLINSFPDQRNIVHVTKGESTHSLMLDAKKRNDRVKFQE